MQEVLIWEKGIEEYQTGFARRQKERPCRCRECGCTKLHRWGSYMRYVAEESRAYRIPVQRYRCVRCLRTYSSLPSFCLKRLGYSADMIMKLLEALILGIQKVAEELKRQAYIYLKRFARLESLWLFFLRGKGFGSLPQDRKERRAKIFVALLEQYGNKAFAANFLAETGRHFMAVK